MKKLLLALLLACPLSAWAADGEVCLASLEQANPVNKDSITNETTFECLTAGKVTIPELYKKGWRVVTAIPQMFVHETLGVPVSRWTLVIEKI
jgi:hypothetical protein